MTDVHNATQAEHQPRHGVATPANEEEAACEADGCLGRFLPRIWRDASGTEMRQRYCSDKCRFKAWDAEHPRVKQGDLFRPPVGPQFKGSTYVPKLDQVRLGRQLDRVFQFMLDHKNHTLNEIAQATGSPEASVSARLRDMRRPLHKKGMGLNIVRTRGENGLHFYKWERE